MKKHGHHSVNPFHICERPAPLHAWKPEDNGNPLQVIEDDIRKLMRQLAEAKFASAEGEKRATEETRRFLLSILEVLDAFQRVFDNIEAKKGEMTRQMKIWAGNFRAVHRLLRSMLTERNVTEIENLDNGFDPHWHKIAETVPDPTRPNGSIVQEVHKGYVWQNHILRKAEVVVVRNAATGTGVLPETAAGAGAPSTGTTGGSGHRANEAGKPHD